MTPDMDKKTCFFRRYWKITQFRCFLSGFGPRGLSIEFSNSTMTPKWANPVSNRLLSGWLGKGSMCVAISRPRAVWISENSYYRRCVPRWGDNRFSQPIIIDRAVTMIRMLGMTYETQKIDPQIPGGPPAGGRWAGFIVVLGVMVWICFRDTMFLTPGGFGHVGGTPDALPPIINRLVPANYPGAGSKLPLL